MVLEVVSIVSLMLAIVLLWTQWPTVWVIPASLYLVSALISGWVEPLGLVWVSILFAIIYWHIKAPSSWSKALSLSALVIVCLLFATHLLPGFNTLEWFPDTRLSEYSGWSELRFTADKPMVALGLLLAYRSTLCRTFKAWYNALHSTAGVMLLGISAVYVLGLAIGYVVIDVSLSLLVIIWFFRNLLFTVIAEEMFFRTVLQSRIQAAIPDRYSGVVAIGAIAVFFGLVHVYAGITYGLLAAAAGTLYGYVYYRSGQVETAILAHALLNLGHVVFLSYPHAKAVLSL